jgi:exosortase
MSLSLFPAINYLVWISLKNRVRPLLTGSVMSGPYPDNQWRALGDLTWEETSSGERSQTSGWLAFVLLSTLVLMIYAPVLGSLARQWWNDPNYSHGFFVPLFAGYVLWSSRHRWLALPLRPKNFGLAIMILAVALRVLGMLGAEMFTVRLSLLILICGIVLFLAGSRVLRSMAFPIGYLLFMIPLPAIIYFQLTMPLQLWASQLGASGLVALGIHTVREGNLLFLPNCTLNVVEACSGIRSLLSLLAVVVAYAYLAEPITWKRVALAIASIPIAIATNGLRLVATGVLSYFFGPAFDSGLIHLVLGLVFFALAFLSILLLHKALRQPTSHQNCARVSP